MTTSQKATCKTCRYGDAFAWKNHRRCIDKDNAHYKSIMYEFDTYRDHKFKKEAPDER